MQNLIEREMMEATELWKDRHQELHHLYLVEGHIESRVTRNQIKLKKN